jgi:hypothetical protein
MHLPPLVFDSPPCNVHCAGAKVNTKRIVPDQPKAGRHVEGGRKVITLEPLAYVGLYQG